MAAGQAFDIEGTAAADTKGSEQSLALDELPVSEEERALHESRPVRSFFASLDERQVRYCHWKSNIRLNETIAGKQDLDVLVHPLDANLLLNAMAANGYKLQFPRRGAGYPAVFHALALDDVSGQLVDLHGYHQLVSGDSLVKTYHFPVEEQLLANVSTQLGVKVPSPPAEVVLFLLRILLKHTRVVEAIKINGNYHKTSAELAWLLRRSEVGDVSAMCREWFPTLTVSAADMIACVAPPDAVLRRVMLGRRVAHDLRHLTRLSPFAAQLSHIRLVLREIAKVKGGPRDRSLLAGGAWIAFVGPKGTGKSTLAKLVAKRMGRFLDVRRIHVGKPPKGLLSSLAAPVIALSWRVLRSDRLNHYERAEKRQERRFPLLYVLHKLLLARDRRRLLTRATRAMTAGSIIISDRCPATNFTGIDGSAFDDLAVERAPSRLHRSLMEAERRIYRGLPKPRLVLKLSVDVETALRRDRERQKPGGPTPKAVQRRWDLENHAEFEGSSVAVLDASGSIEETARECMRRTWDAL